MSKVSSFWTMAVACALLIGWQPLMGAEGDTKIVAEDAEETLQEDAQNAVTYYLRAAELLPDISWEERRQLRDALEKQDVVACSNLLQKHNGVVDQVLKLAALGLPCDKCDWGTDYSDGPNTLLPHTSDARLVVMLGFARALERAHEGQWDQALDVWTCSMTVARHISHDPCLVCVTIALGEERIGIAIAEEMVSRIENEQQRTRLREAWESLPDRPSVHSVAIKDHAQLIAWAKGHPGELLQHVGSSFVSGGLAGYHISSEPPTFFERFQGAVLVQSTDWQEIERLVWANVEITRLPIDEIEEASQDLVAQIRRLPKGSTRKIADHLIWSVDHCRRKECELEKLAEDLSKALRELPK